MTAPPDYDGHSDASVVMLGANQGPVTCNARCALSTGILPPSESLAGTRCNMPRLEVGMVIRIASFDKKPAAHDDRKLMDEFRSWMKSQPGFRAAWHAHDSKTGKAQSISVWSDMPSVLAMKDRTFPGGPMGIKPDKVELFDEVEEF